jgi:hypothetical protein
MTSAPSERSRRPAECVECGCYGGVGSSVWGYCFAEC